LAGDDAVDVPAAEPRALSGAITDRKGAAIMATKILATNLVEWFLLAWVLVGLVTVVYVCHREGHGAWRWIISVFTLSWLGPMFTLLTWRAYRAARADS
jgi:hypothetical protein